MLDVPHRHHDCRAGANSGALHEVRRHLLRNGGEPTSVACPRSSSVPASPRPPRPSREAMPGCMSRSSTATASRSSRMAAALRLHSKSGYDWTKRLALLAEALAGIRCKSAVIDAELVFPTSEGHPDFRAPAGGHR